jgi:hypothetical protein
VNNFVIETFVDTYPLVKFYTVRWDNTLLSETDKFFQRFLETESLQNYREDFDEIVALIRIMGEQVGAAERFFRFEDAAQALPPKSTVYVRQLLVTDGQNTLRLYCTRLRDNIVVLFNGGIKSSQKVSNSPDLAVKFREAQHFAKKIDKAIQEKDILIDENNGLLYSPNRIDEMLIY